MTRHNDRRSRQAGYTLMEMLIVLVIIGLLAGLVGPRLLTYLDRSKHTTAEAQIKMLRTAVESLRVDIGRYPTSEEGLSLLTENAINHDNWFGPYLENDVPLDPWGERYRYAPASTGSGDFHLYSFGADLTRGGTGSDRDIGNPPAG